METYQEQINTEAWYDDETINTYLNVRLQTYRRSDYSYLLFNGSSNTFPDADGKQYLVAITPAIDVASYAAPIDSFLDKTKLKPPDPGRPDERRDVFDELMPFVKTEANCNIKILFLYNLTLVHWLVGEIKIFKQSNDYHIEIFAHNSYGGGKMFTHSFAIIKTAIIKRIQQEYNSANFNAIENKLSHYTRRQAIGDGSSCGPIAAEDVVKRVEGITLNLLSPYELGALVLREQQLLAIKQSYDENDPTRIKFIRLVTSRYQVANTKIIEHESKSVDLLKIAIIFSLLINIHNSSLKDKLIKVITRKVTESYAQDVADALAIIPSELESQSYKLDAHDYKIINDLHAELFLLQGNLLTDKNFIEQLQKQLSTEKSVNINTIISQSAQESHPQTSILEQLQAITLQIEIITTSLKEQVNNSQSNLETQAIIIEALYKISWRSNELPRSLKYNNKAIKLVFAERNWFLLDNLAEAITEFNSNYSNDMWEVIIFNIGAVLDAKGNLMPDGDLAELQQGITTVIQVISNNNVSDDIEIVKLDKLEQFVAMFTDKRLLIKIEKTLGIIFNEKVDQKYANERDFLAIPRNQQALFRALEIIGECAKNISHSLRIADAIIPWQNNSINSITNPLVYLRNKLQHFRSVVHYLIKNRPEIFADLLNSLTIICKRSHQLLEQYNLLQLTKTDCPNLTNNVAAKITAVKFDNKVDNADIYDKALVYINNLNNEIDNSNQAINELINELQSILKDNIKDIYKDFSKPILDFSDFVNRIDPYLDENKINSHGYSAETKQLKLKEVYRRFIGRRLSAVEIERALASKNIDRNIDIKAIKAELRNTLLNTKGIKFEEFFNRYIANLYFDKEHWQTIRQKDWQTTPEKELELIFPIIHNTIKVDEITSILTLDSQKADDSTVGYEEMWQEYNDIVVRLKEVKQPPRKNVTKVDLEDLLIFSEEKNDYIEKLSKKPIGQLSKEEKEELDIIAEQIRSEQEIDNDAVILIKEWLLNLKNPIIPKFTEAEFNLLEQLLKSVDDIKKTLSQPFNKITYQDRLGLKKIVKELQKLNPANQPIELLIKLKKIIYCAKKLTHKDLLKLPGVDKTKFEKLLKIINKDPAKITSQDEKEIQMFLSKVSLGVSDEYVNDLKSISSRLQMNKTPPRSLTLRDLKVVFPSDKVAALFEIIKKTYKMSKEEESQLNIEINNLAANIKQFSELVIARRQAIKDIFAGKISCKDIDEFSETLRQAFCDDKQTSQLKAKFLHLLYLNDHTILEEKITKIIACVREDLSQYDVLVMQLNAEIFHGTPKANQTPEEKAFPDEEVLFANLVKQCGYTYAPYFDELYTKAKNRHLTRKEINSVTEKIKVMSVKNNILSILERTKNNNMINTEQARMEERNNYRSILNEHADLGDNEVEKISYMENALQLYDKLYSKSKKKSLPLLELKGRLLQHIKLLDSLFDDNTSSSLDITGLATEYVLEGIGQLTHKLADDPEFIASEHISISKRNLYRLNLYRKSMAHYPLQIEDDLLMYVSSQLVLETKAALKDEKPIALGYLAQQAQYRVAQTVTVEQIEKNKALIQTHVRALGFKPDFKIFSKLLNCDLGIHADLNLIVACEKEIEEKASNVIELELRLSQALDVEVKAYTETSIGRRFKLLLTIDQIKTIINEAVEIEDIIRGNNFVKIFREDRWSAFILPGNRILTKDQYLLLNDIENIFSPLINNIVSVNSVAESLESIKILTKCLDNLLQDYNKLPQANDKLLKLIDAINCMSPAPVRGQHEFYIRTALFKNITEGISYIFPDKLIKRADKFIKLTTLPESLPKKNKKRKKVKCYRANYYYCPITEQHRRYDLILKTIYEHVVNQRKILNTSHWANFIAGILFKNKKAIVKLLQEMPPVSERLIFQAVNVDYAYSQETINKEREDIKTYRLTRLEQKPEIRQIIRKKAINYLQNIATEFNKLSEKGKYYIYQIIVLDKKITALLLDYFHKNEYEITLLWHSLTEQQKMNSLPQAGSTLNELPINSAYAFCLSARANLDMIKDINIREQLLSLRQELNKLMTGFHNYLIKHSEKHYYVRVQAEPGSFLTPRQIQQAIEPYMEKYQQEFMNAQAYYMYFVFITREIINPEIINILYHSQKTSEVMIELLIKDFEILYCDQHGKEQYSYTIEGKTLVQGNFSNEVEFDYYKTKLESRKQLIARAKADTSLPEVIRTLILANQGEDYYLQKTSTAYTNSPYSDICTQIALGAIERKPPLELSTLEDIQLHIIKYKTHKIQIRIAAEIKSTVAVKRYIKDLNELMDLYQWPVEKKAAYKTFAADDQIVKNYYIYRKLLEELAAIGSQNKDFMEKIEYKRHLLKIGKADYSNFQLAKIQTEIEIFVQKLEQNQARQIELLQELLLSAYMTDLIRRRLSHPDTINSIIAKLEKFVGNEQDVKAKELIDSTKAIIEKDIQQEILIYCGVNLDAQERFLLMYGPASNGEIIIEEKISDNNSQNLPLSPVWIKAPVNSDTPITKLFDTISDPKQNPNEEEEMPTMSYLH